MATESVDRPLATFDQTHLTKKAECPEEASIWRLNLARPAWPPHGDHTRLGIRVGNVPEFCSRHLATKI